MNQVAEKGACHLFPVDGSLWKYLEGPVTKSGACHPFSSGSRGLRRHVHVHDQLLTGLQVF